MEDESSILNPHATRAQRVKRKGASAAQDAQASAMAAYTTTLQQQQQTAYAGQQSVLTALQGAWGPVLAAGPNQTGFSAAQRTALNTQATEGTGAEYQKAQQAFQQGVAARNGGNEVLPSGVDDAASARIATAAAADQSAKKLNIVNADYAAGRQNFGDATSALMGAAGLENPTAFAGAANTSAQNSFNAATTVQQMNNAGSFWNTIGGVLGGAAGAFLGGSGGFLGKLGGDLANNVVH